MFQLAAGLEAKQGDRVWLKNQTDGELDDAKLVEGTLGIFAILLRQPNIKLSRRFQSTSKTLKIESNCARNTE